jgi:TerB N-terminal domain
MVQLKSGHCIAGVIYTASGLVRGADEPSAINEGWQVASSPQPYHEPPRSWASYHTLSPQQRRAYLDWLAADRLDKGTTPMNSVKGGLFLFFYGLERRLLWDGDWDFSLFDERN